MPAPPLPQGTLDLLILKILATGPRHGYGIARRIEETTDDVLSVEEGSLYPALYRMAHRRWISSRWRRSELGKRIKVYELTADGEAELRRRTAEWGSMTSAVARVLRSR